MKSPSPLAPACWTLLLLLGSVACSPAPQKPSTRAAVEQTRDAVRTAVERGPVQVVLELTPARPRLSDEPILHLRVAAEQGVKVELPPFGSSIGGFVVRSFNEALPVVDGNRKILNQTYRLEPLETGTHVIRPITVAFTDARPGGDGARHTVTTEPLRVEVSSLLASDAPRLEDVRPPEGALRMPLQHSAPWLLTGLLAGLLIVSLSVWIWIRRRRGTRENVLTAAEQARRELEQLLRDDPLRRGELQTFYVALTGIVRRYIERTCGVRAPEQTTEEFLLAMRSHPSFGDASRVRLQAFLEAADLVKFAALRPTLVEIAEGFRRAQEFVGLEGSLRLPEVKVP